MIRSRLPWRRWQEGSLRPWPRYGGIALSWPQGRHRPAWLIFCEQLQATRIIDLEEPLACDAEELGVKINRLVKSLQYEMTFNPGTRLKWLSLDIIAAPFTMAMQAISSSKSPMDCFRDLRSADNAPNISKTSS
jgi:hypothetical protein